MGRRLIGLKREGRWGVVKENGLHDKVFLMARSQCIVKEDVGSFSISTTGEEVRIWA